MKTIRIQVTGKVQGVFYRQSTAEKARALGVKGHVRNCEDGSVEVVASGTPAQLAQLVSWCKQGPPKASVNDIYTTDLPEQDFGSFSILR